MDNIQRLKNLAVPTGKIDVVLDTDAYNEIDDQFAIAYLLRSTEKLNTKALYAAPFYYPAVNDKSTSPADGMEKSYQEILKILELAGETKEVYRGSEAFLPDEETPVISDAAKDLAERANQYSPEKPLYVVAIGAITNVASAILLNPAVAENTVVVWLSGNAHHHQDTEEFNMAQDIAAARVVMKSGVPFVQLPCCGVVTRFIISQPELEKWLKGKNKLADYLAVNTIEEAHTYAGEGVWSRVIWDVTTIGWLLNDNERFMHSRTIPTPLPTYDKYYAQRPNAHFMEYVYHIERDALLTDLIDKLTK